MAALLLDRGADKEAKTTDVSGGVLGRVSAPSPPLHALACGVHLRLCAGGQEV